MLRWLDELHDDTAALEEHTEDAAPIAWARVLRRDLDRDDAVAAVLSSGAPPVVRRIALEELAR